MIRAENIRAMYIVIVREGKKSNSMGGTRSAGDLRCFDVW